MAEFTSTVITEEDILQAADRVRPLVRKTPILTLAKGELGVDLEITLKLEYLQHTGSFKARGAINSVLTAPAGTSQVVAASGGNHGAAVAWAAQQAHLSATVFVPSFSPRAKQNLIRSFGADLRVVDGFYADALTASHEMATATGALPIDAYDSGATVAGQAGVGVELKGQIPADQPVIVACGGGGLFAGVSLALAGRNPVFPAEPESTPSMRQALAAGQPLPVEVSGVAVDSLGARQIGRIGYAVARENAARVLSVPDTLIRNAVSMLWDRARIHAEPGGATGLAAALQHASLFDSGSVTVVLSGANSDQTAGDTTS